MGCGIILSYRESFLGFIMVLIYLRVMLVVFESWGSNIVVLGALAMGLVIGLVLVGLWCLEFHVCRMKR